MRNGYGIYNNENLIIESIWKLDKINDYVSVKYKDSLSFRGYAMTGVQPIYENDEMIKPVTNCFGLTRVYWSNGKMRYVGHYSKGKKNSKFSMVMGKNGQLSYVGGFENDLFDGKGVEFSSDRKFEIKRKGVFRSGVLSGGIGYEMVDDAFNCGYFMAGQVQNTSR